MTKDCYDYEPTHGRFVVIADWKNGGARIIPNVYGHNLTPSVVGLDDNGQMLVGMWAEGEVGREATFYFTLEPSRAELIGTSAEERRGNPFKCMNSYN